MCTDDSFHVLSKVSKGVSVNCYAPTKHGARGYWVSNIIILCSCSVISCMYMTHRITQDGNNTALISKFSLFLSICLLSLLHAIFTDLYVHTESELDEIAISLSVKLIP